MSDKYLKAIDTITSQGKFHICLGLERVSKVLELFGNPQDAIKVIHVAGTNGKGSVCAMLSAILTAQGYKTGLYTSPHLIDYTERIKINDKDISKDSFADYVSQTCDMADQNNVHLTEFEILTVSAYRYFYDENVDIAIIETGLGGRLDATNVISSNVLSIITSISIDHTDRLGDSVEKIAYEKAGIIKADSDLVISDKNAGLTTINTVATEMSSVVHLPTTNVELLFEHDVNYAIFNGIKTELGLLGLCQKDNLELVIEAVKILRKKGIEISEKSLTYGIKTVKWPARMQFLREKNILIDGAHNIDAAKRLVESLNYYFPQKKRAWIYGSLNTKEYEKITSTLFSEVDEVHIYEFKNKNSIKLEDIKVNKKIKINKINIAKAENMLNNYDPNCLKIISGSFYMIGEIFNSLKM